MALQLISVPICLTFWGKGTYGSWLAVYAAFLLIRSLDGGFVAYVGSEINQLYHRDQEALRQHLASAVSGVVLVCILELSVAIAVVYSHRLASTIGVRSNDAGTYLSSIAVLVLVGAWVLSGPYLGIVHRLLIPTGFMYQAVWWSMAFQFAQFLAIVLAAILRFNILTASIFVALIQVSIYIGSAIYVRRLLPTYYPWWRGGQAKVGFKDLGRSTLLTGSNLIQQASTNGIVLLIALLSGPAAVPVFSTVRTVSNLWTNVTNVLTAPLLPDIVRYHATSQARKIVALGDAYWVVVGSAVNAGVLLTYPIVKALYGYWTAHAVALNNPLFCILLASVVVTNTGGLMSLYLNGINSLKTLLLMSVVRAASTLAIGSFLFSVYGLTGFGLAILLGEVLALIVSVRSFANHMTTTDGDKHPLLPNPLPIALSSGSVLVFLIAEAFRPSLGWLLYPAALCSVFLTALWGWRRLPQEVSGRLVELVRFGSRGPTLQE